MNDGRIVRNNRLHIKPSFIATHHIIDKSKSTLIRNAMNKTFQKIWMPTEQPDGDHNNEDSRTRTENVDCTSNKDRKKDYDGSLGKNVRITRGGRQINKPKRYI